jgi:hypothetical protein
VVAEFDQAGEAIAEAVFGGAERSPGGVVDE